MSISRKGLIAASLFPIPGGTSPTGSLTEKECYVRRMAILPRRDPGLPAPRTPLL